jgi:Spy/CpxP family protein refolding chaperone
VQPLREELFKKRQELMLLLRDEEMDREKADMLIGQIAAMQAEHDAQIFDHLLVMRKILTPEQRQRLGTLMYALLESGRPPGMPEAPIHPHHHFELPREKRGR